VRLELDSIELLEPEPAGDTVLALAHDADYIERVVNASSRRASKEQSVFPWSTQMVERSRRSVGATIGACLAALSEGVAVNLAGGTHHATRTGGQGYWRVQRRCDRNPRSAGQSMQERGARV